MKNHEKQNTSLLCYCSFYAKHVRKLSLFQRKQGTPEAHVSTEAQPSAVHAAHPVLAERNGGKRERGTHGATNCLSCPHNIILNDPKCFQDADCGNYFPVFWGDAIEIFSSWCDSPGIEFYLLIPQHKVHAERSEVRVMMCHHFRMKTQSPPTSFGVWPLTPWHHKTNPVYARALPLHTRSLQVFKFFLEII